MSTKIFPVITKVSADIIFSGGAVMVRLTAPNKTPQVMLPEKWLIDFFNLGRELEEANNWLENRFVAPRSDWKPISAEKLRERLAFALTSSEDVQTSRIKFKNKS